MSRGQEKGKKKKALSQIVGELPPKLTGRAEPVVVRADPRLRLKPPDIDELGPVGVDQDREGDGL